MISDYFFLYGNLYKIEVLNNPKMKKKMKNALCEPYPSISKIESAPTIKNTVKFSIKFLAPNGTILLSNSKPRITLHKVTTELSSIPSPNMHKYAQELN